MKKLLGVFLACTLAISLTACSGGSRENETAAETETQMTVTETAADGVTEEAVTETVTEGATEEAVTETVTEGVTEETEAETEETAVETETEMMVTEAAEAESTATDENILIAYFSWSGNTEALAEMIQSEVGGDLFRIETAEPYTDDYDTLLDIAQAEQQEGARPQLSGQVENWDSYDVIFVGYPNWWSDAPMAVYTFLETYDFDGKTLIPFNTSASGGFDRSLSGIEESAAGANILDGLALTEGELGNARNEVSGWLAGLGLE